MLTIDNEISFRFTHLLTTHAQVRIMYLSTIEDIYIIHRANPKYSKRDSFINEIIRKPFGRVKTGIDMHN